MGYIVSKGSRPRVLQPKQQCHSTCKAESKCHKNWWGQESKIKPSYKGHVTFASLIKELYRSHASCFSHHICKDLQPLFHFLGLHVQSNMCTNEPFQMVTLGNWQEFTYLGDPRDLLSNARTKLSIIPHLRLDIRCPRIQSMFKVVLDILEQMSHSYLSHSTISALPRVVTSRGWQDFYKVNWFFCGMMKDKENSSKILFLDNILSSDILAHGRN